MRDMQPIYMKPGKFDFEYQLTDDLYRYQIEQRNVEVGSTSKVLKIDSDFKAKIDFKDEPYQAREYVSFYREDENLEVIDDEGNKLLSINTKENNKKYMESLPLTNKDNPSETYVYDEIDLRHPYVVLPNTSGTFKVVFTVPELEKGEVQRDDETDDESVR